uniref:Uncharacterized protein n=1 Tax=Sphaerodactylus townsendi TaxID=933632 RepID=A0ACB8EFL3_9SAUR
MWCAGTVGYLCRASPHQIKEEPEEGLAERWEARWQEFLGTGESPHSSWAVPQLPEKSTPWDDAKAFLASFEQVAEACQWPQEEWVTRLRPALSGEVELAFFSLEARDRENYGKVPLEETSGSVPEAGQDLSENERRQPSMIVKEEEDGEACPLEARGWMTTEDGEEYAPKDYRSVESGGMSMWKVEKNVSQCREQENVPAFCGDIYNIVFETTVQTGVEAEGSLILKR